MPRPETIKEWKDYLKDILDASQFMVLATSNGSDMWVCPVYFAYDDSFMFFFLSKPSSRHMQNIAENSEVACAIFDPLQHNVGKVRGVQVAGQAHKVEASEAKHAFDTYFAHSHTRTPVSPRGGPLLHIGDHSDWWLMKIIPSNIECFDEHVFHGEEGISQGGYKR